LVESVALAGPEGEVFLTISLAFFANVGKVTTSFEPPPPPLLEVPETVKTGPLVVTSTAVNVPTGRPPLVNTFTVSLLDVIAVFGNVNVGGLVPVRVTTTVTFED